MNSIQSKSTPHGAGIGQDGNGVDHMDTSSLLRNSKTISPSLTDTDLSGEIKTISPSLTDEKINSGIKTIEPENHSLSFDHDFPEITQKFLDDMVVHFSNAPKYEEKKEIIFTKMGDIREVVKQVALPPPLIGKYIRGKGMSLSKFKKAAKSIPELAEVIEECEDIIKEFMIEHGLLGNYQSQFGIFTAKNITDMKDKSEIQSTSVDVKGILDSLEGKRSK